MTWLVWKLPVEIMGWDCPKGNAKIEESKTFTLPQTIYPNHPNMTMIGVGLNAWFLRHQDKWNHTTFSYMIKLKPFRTAWNRGFKRLDQ